MASASPATSGKIVLNFAWQGPNQQPGERSDLQVRTVDLVFRYALNQISVELPGNINPVTPQKFPFTRRHYQVIERSAGQTESLVKTTHPDSLRVTIEQIRHLTVRAGFFGQSDVPLDIPEELEPGQTYRLVVSSAGLSLSARLEKETVASPLTEDGRNEFQRRVGNMGAALIEEGIRNLQLASSGGGPLAGASTADVYAHGIQGVIRAGQQMHPDIRVPGTTHSQSPDDLDRLTASELQSLFETTFTRDKELESARLRAATAGNMAEFNRIVAEEMANSQCLINLSEALERKGIRPQIPQSTSFVSAANASAQLHTEALQGLQQNCHMQ